MAAFEGVERFEQLSLRLRHVGIGENVVPRVLGVTEVGFDERRDLFSLRLAHGNAGRL